MNRLLALTLTAVILVTGCALLGGSAGVTTRIMAGLTCVTAIAAAGGQVASDPDLGFATAIDALNAVNKIASGPGLTAALAACQDTLSYIAQDVAGATAMLTAKAEAPAEPPAARRARLSRHAPKAQAGPILVTVPLRR